MTEILFNCKECGLPFSNKKILANHIRWKHRDNSKWSEVMSESANKRYDTKLGKVIEKSVICENCNNEFTVKERELKKREKYFCSRSCSNSRKHSVETKKKLSDSIKAIWKDDAEYAVRVLSNRNEVCVTRSKSELEILDWLKRMYPSYNWTSGGCIKYKNERLVRDAYSDDLKICVEYDGIWHFKDIHGQLNKKIHKDNLLNSWCEDHGYSMIRIKEERFMLNKDECFSILAKTIDARVKGLTLIY